MVDWLTGRLIGLVKWSRWANRLAGLDSAQASPLKLDPYSSKVDTVRGVIWADCLPICMLKMYLHKYIHTYHILEACSAGARFQWGLQRDSKRWIHLDSIRSLIDLRVALATCPSLHNAEINTYSMVN